MAQPVLHFKRSTRDTLYEEIVESLEGLPEVLRTVFTRSHYDGKSTEKISQEMGIPVDSVDQLLADANQIFYQNLHNFHFRS